uniref:C2H2-type domain-containing protein n=1 Tax=Anopheles atroparvus TaxID=41427 RepID=A0AAG5D9P8_ANOAO
MSVFNLLTFPDVCRACLQPQHPDQMVPLDSHRPLLKGDIGTFLQEITFEIPEPVLPYLPTAVCYTCLEMIEFFFKYRKKMSLLHQFQVALGQVKCGDEASLKQLFSTQTEQLEMLFKDLGLSNIPNAQAEDLLGEYEQYMIAAMPAHHPQADEFVEEIEIKTYDTDDTEEISETVSCIGDCKENPDAVSIEQSSENNVLEEDPIEEECSLIIEPIATSKIPRKLRSVASFKKRIPQKRRKLVHSEQSESINEIESDGDVEERQEPSAKERKPRSHLYGPDSVDQLRNCKLCSYKTYYTVVYELHLRKHEANEGKQGYICSHPYCLKLFGTKEELKKHREDNNPHKYVCDVCGARLKHRPSFDAHMERHVGITHFQCSYCSSTFVTLSEVSAHLAAVHLTEDREKCQVCGALFTTKKHLNQHLQSHSTERNHQCSECAASFKSQHHLHRHVKTVHHVVRYNCEHCHMTYGRRDKLRLHLERVHLIQAYFVCHTCVRSFETEDALQEHLFHHANPKDLECGTCLMVCRSQESFETHLCITYQDNYVCCGRDFKNHLRYNRHMASHGVQINARVRPDKNLLIGQARTKRDSRRSAAKQYPAVSKETLEVNVNAEFLCLYCGLGLPTKESLEHHICENFPTDGSPEEQLSMPITENIASCSDLE